MSIQKNDPDYSAISYDQILKCKELSLDNMKKEYKKLEKVKDKPNGFYGNKIIYSLFLKEMIETRRDKKNYKTIEDMFSNEDDKKKLIDLALKVNRRPKLTYIEPVDIYEAHRLCYGSINTFKACQVKSIIDRFGGSHLLDPTAGWGGRLLGTISSGLEYTGIDTNTNLRDGYEKMIDICGGGNMIWESCLDVDFSEIDYDLVLTSPPYINLEKYNNMTLFSSDEIYYKEFLIPLIDRLRSNIKRNGKVCINISDYMYKDYLKYGGTPCKQCEDLNQQMGGKKNKELIYIW